MTDHYVVLLDFFVKQLDNESKKNLRLANRYFLEMMRKLEKVLLKHWRIAQTPGELKRLADQVHTVEGNNEAHLSLLLIDNNKCI